VGNNREEYKDKSEIVVDQETGKQEKIIVETPIINNNTNYIGTGLIKMIDF